MDISAESHHDWTYYTGYVEDDQTFIVVYPKGIADSTKNRKCDSTLCPLPPAGSTLKLSRGSFFLVPYTPFHNGLYAQFSITPQMQELQLKHVMLQAGDLCISSYPRSGCTWIEQMVLLLLADGRDELLIPATKNSYNPSHPHLPGKIFIDLLFHGRPPGTEVGAPWGTYCGQGYPYTVEDVQNINIHPVINRFLKSHYPVGLAMKGVDGKGPPAPGAKYILPIRDPKDVAVSLFRVNSCNFQKMGMPFPAFIKLFLDGKSHYGDWAQFHTEWLSLAALHPDQFLILTFENMVARPRYSIAAMAKFLEIKFDDDLLDKCVQYSSFKHMKERSKTATAEHVHVGNAGGWKQHMTKEMVESFNKLVDDESLGEYRKMYWVSPETM